MAGAHGPAGSPAAGPAIGHGQVPVGRRGQDDPSGERLAVLGVQAGSRPARDGYAGAPWGLWA